MIDNPHAKASFEMLCMSVIIIVAIISVITWFIFWIDSSTEAERLKHETCMVVTAYTGETSNRVISTVTEYCGPNKEPL